MSSSYPPPQGQNPYQSDPTGQPAPYGQNPYGQPPKKSNAIWWIVGGIVALFLLCCGGIGAFIALAGNEVNKELESYSSSSSAGEEGVVVTEGGSFRLADMEGQSGWTIETDSFSSDIEGLVVKNAGTRSDSYMFNIVFSKDDVVLDDALCSTSQLAPGQSTTATCLGPFDSIDGYDTIRVTS